MKYVLEELTKTDLQKLFGPKEQQILKYFMYKSLYSQPELLPDQSTLPIQIPKEHIEQWIVQALGVKSVGAGSYPIDVYSETQRWGADVKMLSAELDNNNNIKEHKESGETSLAQKFRSTGVNLDSLFTSKQFETIKDQWLQIYREKYKKVFEQLPINTIYYFFIIRAGANFYLVGMKVHFDNIHNIIVHNESKREQAVVLDNFIDDKLGTTRIYKAKKRLELRLFTSEWVKRNNYIKFECNFNLSKIDLRKEIIDDASMSKRLSKLASDILFTPIKVQ